MYQILLFTDTDLEPDNDKNNNMVKCVKIIPELDSIWTFEHICLLTDTDVILVLVLELGVVSSLTDWFGIGIVGIILVWPIGIAIGCWLKPNIFTKVDFILLSRVLNKQYIYSDYRYY